MHPDRIFLMPDETLPTGPDQHGDHHGALPDDPSLSCSVIGPYHLIERIGYGGMGEVWLAEQKSPVHRHVALKLIKGGINTREIVTRFESERQALALMSHPAIAKVFDAGTTPEGLPYFVMEYVDGVPITEYCDSHRLCICDRLASFVQVCHGVEHAHQKAIIHRDLKPSNILTSEVDGKPFPKIIDFGIAKATSPRLLDKTALTQFGVLIGTPEYLSPEQAAMEEDIDTRSDVYSLGVVFYELLVGAMPFELTQNRSLPLNELLRRIREDDAPRPSTKIRSAVEQAPLAASNRGTEPHVLRKQLKGDLDAIALKALEKDRSRRYGSPSEFASDIERYLRNEPVGHTAISYLSRRQVHSPPPHQRRGFGWAGCGLARTGCLINAVFHPYLTRTRSRQSRSAGSRARLRFSRWGVQRL